MIGLDNKSKNSNSKHSKGEKHFSVIPPPTLL